MKPQAGLILTISAALSCFSVPAQAETANSVEPAETTDEAAPIAISQHEGHFKLGLSTGFLALPYGRLGSGLSLGDVARTGFGFGGDLAFGVGYSVELGVYGDWSRLGKPNDCDACDVSASSFGIFAKAYLVQGLRVAPWVSYGVGTRLYNVKGLSDVSATTQQGTYISLEWLRLGLGIDWFATQNFGVGGFLNLSAAQVIGRPSNYVPSSDLSRKNGAEGRFLSGVRIFFDLPGQP